MECVVSLSFFIFRQNSENYDGIYVAFPLKRKRILKKFNNPCYAVYCLQFSVTWYNKVVTERNVYNREVI